VPGARKKRSRRAAREPLIRLFGFEAAAQPRDLTAFAGAEWTALTRYCEDGDLAIDDNASERALRKVIAGRRNWLFCGSDAGGGRATILHSLVATCKAHGIDP